MKHTAAGHKPHRPNVRSGVSRAAHGGMPSAKDLDRPTVKAAQVRRYGQRPSKKGW